MHRHTITKQQLRKIVKDQLGSKIPLSAVRAMLENIGYKLIAEEKFNDALFDKVNMEGALCVNAMAIENNEIIFRYEESRLLHIKNKYAALNLIAPGCSEFYCLSGWAALIDATLSDVVDIMDSQRPFRITEIREKHGALLFEVKGNPDCTTNPKETDAYFLLKIAVAQSLMTCDVCGAPGILRRSGSYNRTRCDAHEFSYCCGG